MKLHVLVFLLLANCQTSSKNANLVSITESDRSAFAPPAESFFNSKRTFSTKTEFKSPKQNYKYETAGTVEVSRVDSDTVKIKFEFDFAQGGPITKAEGKKLLKDFPVSLHYNLTSEKESDKEGFDKLLARIESQAANGEQVEFLLRIISEVATFPNRFFLPVPFKISELQGRTPGEVWHIKNQMDGFDLVQKQSFKGWSSSEGKRFAVFTSELNAGEEEFKNRPLKNEYNPSISVLLQQLISADWRHMRASYENQVTEKGALPDAETRVYRTYTALDIL